MSIEFTVYEKATGKVLYGGTASDPSVFASAANDVVQGQSHSEGYFSVGTHYSIPERASASHIFDWAAKQWIDPRTLPDLKDAKWKAIKSAREAEIASNLVTQYGTFDADDRARSNITDAILMLQTLASAGRPTTIDFTLADNSTVTLTTSELVTVGLFLGQKVQIAHATARARRLDINAATTAAQLEAITWAGI